MVVRFGQITIIPPNLTVVPLAAMLIACGHIAHPRGNGLMQVVLRLSGAMRRSTGSKLHF